MTWLIPLGWLAWALLFPGFKTATKAQKNALMWWYPTQSKRGNHPPAQRTHEGGGFRFGALLTLPVLLAIAAASAQSGSAFDEVEAALAGTVGEQVGAGLPLIAQALLSLLAVFAVFLATRKWIDIAEHGAEILHAERDGIEGYRAAEIERMHRTTDYRDQTPEAIAKALIGAEWRSRIILFLGRW